MILWLALFLLVVAISFVLAYQSISDFQDIPGQKDEEYSLFLVRLFSGLTAEILNSIHQDIVKEGLIISLERLFKGRKSALVIFGPRQVLLKYAHLLNLLELEDYTNVDREFVQAWEVDMKNVNRAYFDLSLSEDEQVWWQLTLKAKKMEFISQIRASVFAKDPSRRKDLSEALKNARGFAKIPKPFSSSQIFDFYHQRSLTLKDAQHFLTTEEIVKTLV